MSHPTTIYKIFRRPQWTAAEAAGRFEGSPDDLRDGFIHFSTQSQLPGTIAKFFAGDTDLIIAAVEADTFGDDLRWETSRDGQPFPHLYAPWDFTASPPRTVPPPPLS